MAALSPFLPHYVVYAVILVLSSLPETDLFLPPLFNSLLCVFNVLKANKGRHTHGPDVRAWLVGQPQIIHDVIRLGENYIREGEVRPLGNFKHFIK